MLVHTTQENMSTFLKKNS